MKLRNHWPAISLAICSSMAAIYAVTQPKNMDPSRTPNRQLSLIKGYLRRKEKSGGGTTGSLQESLNKTNGGAYYSNGSDKMQQRHKVPDHTPFGGSSVVTRYIHILKSPLRWPSRMISALMTRKVKHTLYNPQIKSMFTAYLTDLISSDEVINCVTAEMMAIAGSDAMVDSCTQTILRSLQDPSVYNEFNQMSSDLMKSKELQGSVKDMVSVVLKAEDTKDGVYSMVSSVIKKMVWPSLPSWRSSPSPVIPVVVPLHEEVVMEPPREVEANTNNLNESGEPVVYEHGSVEGPTTEEQNHTSV